MISRRPSIFASSLAVSTVSARSSSMGPPRSWARLCAWSTRSWSASFTSSSIHWSIMWSCAVAMRSFTACCCCCSSLREAASAGRPKPRPDQKDILASSVRPRASWYFLRSESTLRNSKAVSSSKIRTSARRAASCAKASALGGRTHQGSRLRLQASRPRSATSKAVGLCASPLPSKHCSPILERRSLSCFDATERSSSCGKPKRSFKSTHKQSASTRNCCWAAVLNSECLRCRGLRASASGAGAGTSCPSASASISLPASTPLKVSCSTCSFDRARCWTCNSSEHTRTKLSTRPFSRRCCASELKPRSDQISCSCSSVLAVMSPRLV
mmetsp:Transcript_7789/g.28499  ORF Transcript_7789/g.28499 Transcript_7789/m.28499 type:complete len:328 (+) Transcript_7789:494-1477(+)